MTTRSLAMAAIFLINAIGSEVLHAQADTPGGSPEIARASEPRPGGDTTRTTSLRNSVLDVFLDCGGGCYEDYLKRELTIINYVRDREVADVHILLTSQGTAGGGTRTTLAFIGLRAFAGMTDTLSFSTSSTVTDDVKQRKLLNMLQVGLLRYIARTPWVENTLIVYPRPELITTLESDPWNSWVFNVDLSTSLAGQKSSNSLAFLSTVSANRYTAASKIRLGAEGTYLENRFDIGGERIMSVSRNYAFKGMWALSLDDHWSAGFFGSCLTSTYANTKFSVGIAPAIEYDFFPYQESATRILRVTYRIGPSRVVYYAETIFDRTAETLLSHSLSIAVDLRQPWGDASLSLVGSQYLHDTRKNRLEALGDLSFRLTQGFSLRLSVDVSSIHDQLSLAKFGATPEQVLLYRQELATSYSYYFSAGVSFTFGSIYQNVVNPRFGN